MYSGFFNFSSERDNLLYINRKAIYRRITKTDIIIKNCVV